MKDTSYSIGVLVANNLASQVDLEGVNFEALAKGVVDVLASNDLDISIDEANQKAQEFFQQAAERKAASVIAEGQKFLEENAKRDGIVVRPSGLQYEVLTQGDGAIPEATNQVVAHYEGRLLSGKVFDSSYKRNEPATFPVNGLIPGWQEALQIMPVGSKWRLFIPTDLGYGMRGAGADIPGGATLIFDLELLSIEG